MIYTGYSPKNTEVSSLFCSPALAKFDGIVITIFSTLIFSALPGAENTQSQSVYVIGKINLAFLERLEFLKLQFH